MWSTRRKERIPWKGEDWVWIARKIKIRVGMQVRWLPSCDGRTKLNLSVYQFHRHKDRGTEHGERGPGTAAAGDEHMFGQIHLACHNAQRYAETSQRVGHCYGKAQTGSGILVSGPGADCT